MEKLFEDLKILLDNPNTSSDTKEAIRKMLGDEKHRQERLTKELEEILKK
jgi:hypothetical protein